MVPIHNGILLSHKTSEIMQFAATWMDLQMIIEVSAKHNYNEIPLHTHQKGYYPKQTTSNGEYREKLEPLCLAGRNVYSASIVKVTKKKKERKTKSSYDPAIPLLAIYPEEVKADTQAGN